MSSEVSVADRVSKNDLNTRVSGIRIMFFFIYIFFFIIILYNEIF